MNDLYLVAHKVRNEPAFDVAVKMECPECLEGTDEGFCAECDNTGFWWIIPTSGHRAYPWWHIELLSLGEDQSWPGEPAFQSISSMLSEYPMPPALPDHYRVGPAPRVDIRALLRANRPPSPSVPTIPRRFL